MLSIALVSPTQEKWRFLSPIIRHDGVYLSFLWWSSAFSMGFLLFRQKAQTDRNWGTFAMTSKRYVFLSPSVADFFHSFHPLAFRSRKEIAISDSLTNLNIRTLPLRAARPLILGRPLSSDNIPFNHGTHSLTRKTLLINDGLLQGDPDGLGPTVDRT